MNYTTARPPPNPWLSAGRRLALAYAVGVAVVFVGQRKILYPSVARTREAFETEVALQAASATVIPEFDAVILSPASGAAPAGIAVWLHGNAGTAMDRIGHAPEFLSRGFRFVLAEYPGYGPRPGKPSEEVLVADALALVAEIRRRYPGEPLTLIGESLGSGVAVQVAKALSVDPGLGGTPARVVLLTPFASMRTVAARNMPLLPVKYLVLDRYESAQHILQVRGPVAILVARQDELVSAEEGRELAKAAASRELAGDRLELLEADARHSTWQGVLSSADWDRLLGRQG